MNRAKRILAAVVGTVVCTVGIAWGLQAYKARCDRRECVQVQTDLGALDGERVDLESRGLWHGTAEWEAFSERSTATWARYRSIQKRHPDWQFQPR